MVPRGRGPSRPSDPGTPRLPTPPRPDGGRSLRSSKAGAHIADILTASSLSATSDEALLARRTRRTLIMVSEPGKSARLREGRCNEICARSAAVHLEMGFRVPSPYQYLLGIKRQQVLGGALRQREGRVSRGLERQAERKDAVSIATPSTEITCRSASLSTCTATSLRGCRKRPPSGSEV